MRSMVALIDDNADALRQLCQAHHVVRLDVVGSATTDQFDPDRSDIDLLVEFGSMDGTSRFHNYFAFKRKVEALLDRPVDLIEPAGLTNPFVRKSIEMSRVNLYAA